MTIEDAKTRVQAIKDIAGDDEVAHGTEDHLYQQFIEDIANGQTEDIQEIAKIILTTEDIDFARWCA